MEKEKYSLADVILERNGTAGSGREVMHTAMRSRIDRMAALGVKRRLI
jgi:hypothetical protein